VKSIIESSLPETVKEEKKEEEEEVYLIKLIYFIANLVKIIEIFHNERHE
jgi:hypothetical protein